MAKPREFRDVFGNTKLHIAVKKNNVTEVEELIDGGTDINAKNNVGRTPLFYVNGEKGYYIATLLIIAGADVNSRDSEGKTPMALAMKNNLSDIVVLLRKKGGMA